MDSRNIIEIKRSSSTSLSSTEKNIVQYISTNGRFKLVDVASNLDMTPNAVKYVLERLKSKQVLLGYGVYIDYTMLGYSLYKIIIESYDYESYLKKLISLDGIVFLSLSTDNHVVIDFIAKEVQSVRDFLFLLDSFVVIRSSTIY